MEVRIIPPGEEFACNTYLAIENRQGLLIDPGHWDEKVEAELSSCDLIGVVLTHKHFDHMRGLEELLRRAPDLKIYTHADGHEFFSDAFLNCSALMTPAHPLQLAPRAVIPLSEGNLRIGRFDLRVYLTPGHTSDSVTLRLGENLFTGDFLFPEGIGRCDLPTGDPAQMRESLRRMLPVLRSGRYMIYSGHALPVDSLKLLSVNEYLRRL